VTEIDQYKGTYANREQADMNEMNRLKNQVKDLKY
jgi:hypothetical protein